MQELLSELKAKSTAYRGEVPNLLECQSPELLTEEMIKRDEFKGDIQKAYNALKDKMADLEAECRKLRELKSDQTHDNKKLEARKWDLITERKHHG